jgi:hypothetical protein
MYYHQKDATMTNKCTLSIGRFDGHDGELEQYRQHCPMRHVQGYSRSHWTPASGDYLLLITPASARATGKQTTINKYTNKAGCFNGHRNVAVQYRSIAQWRRSMASLEATGCHHQASTCSNSINQTCQHWVFPMFFIVKSSKKATKQCNLLQVFGPPSLAPYQKDEFTYGTDIGHCIW